jgi:hypothetical protein
MFKRILGRLCRRGFKRRPDANCHHRNNIGGLEAALDRRTARRLDHIVHFARGVASRAKRNLAVRVRQINPTGKSLLIFRNRVNPENQKYSAGLVAQITFTTPPVSPDERGVSRTSQNAGRDAVDAAASGAWTWLQSGLCPSAIRARRRTAMLRTAKTCGPGARIAGVKSAGAVLSRAVVAKEPDSPGRARHKP